jgi:hypothetical protein
MSAPLPADITHVDPAAAWEHWKPNARDPFNARWAGHLFRRAAFGASPERLARAVRDGLEPTIQELLAGAKDHEKNDPLLADIGERFASMQSIDMLRGWWLYVMLNGGHPLREKMTLFWHNHFATSVAKVKSPALMYRQNKLLRKHALGKFGPLLRDIGRDVAMLLWLDSNQNVKGRPNENYARELLELFSLGVGNYTEKDVQEAARAFTGWHTDDEQTAFAFSKDEHDNGTKTVLKRTGKWTGDDLVPILLDQPACGLFLAGKLYREFISETDPPPELLEPLARRFRASDGNIADLVGTILGSRLFFSSHALLRRIKSPVELVLGAVQTAWPGPIGTPGLVLALGKMGQKLFAPPNVKGWPGGRAWLNTSTLLARNNFAEDVALGKGPAVMTRPDGLLDTDAEVFVPAPPAIEPAPPDKKGPPVKYDPSDPPAAFDLAARFKKVDPTKPAEIVDQLLEGLLPGCASDNTRKQISAFLAEGRPTGAHLRERVREAAHAVLCSAEYQLC